MWKSILAGVVGGLAASWAMNRFQGLVSNLSDGQILSQDEDATIKTARAIARNVFHCDLTEAQKQWAGPAVHYGMGAGLGAVYGTLAETAPVTTSGFGLLYGTAAWLVADEIMVPVMGFAKGPAEYEFSSHVNALASHLVYGSVTDLTRRLLLML